MYQQIIDTFKEDEQMLATEPDFSEKEQELEKKFKKAYEGVADTEEQITFIHGKIKKTVFLLMAKQQRVH